MQRSQELKNAPDRLLITVKLTVRGADPDSWSRRCGPQFPLARCSLARHSEMPSFPRALLAALLFAFIAVTLTTDSESSSHSSISPSRPRAAAAPRRLRATKAKHRSKSADDDGGDSARLREPSQRNGAAHALRAGGNAAEEGKRGVKKFQVCFPLNEDARGA